jgi:protein ImuA
VFALRGGLIEWLSDQPGAGSLTLAILATQAALANELWVLVDGAGRWHAPGFVPLPLDLQRIVFVRPERPSDVLWVVEQALRTRGVGAVVCEMDRLSPTAFRRLQLAAETGGGLGILLRPERVRHQPSWAECRLWVRPLATAGPAQGSPPRRRLLVERLRARGALASESVMVELDDADGRVCVASELVVAASAARAAGA